MIKKTNTSRVGLKEARTKFFHEKLAAVTEIDNQYDWEKGFGKLRTIASYLVENEIEETDENIRAILHSRSNEVKKYCEEKGFIYSTEEHITEKALQESAAKLFPVDTVVIAMYGATAGQVGILKTESTTNQAICGIYPNEYYLPEFIYFYLKSKRDYFLSQSTGGAQPNISQLTIKKTMIPSVPIEQQRVIVDAIREEMSIVEQNKRLIEIFQQKIKDKIAEVWGE